MEPALLDTRGLLCPMPLLRLGRAIRHAHESGLEAARLLLLATDEKTLTDIPAYCAEHGLTLETQREENGVYSFEVVYTKKAYVEPIL